MPIKLKYFSGKKVKHPDLVFVEEVWKSLKQSNVKNQG